MFDQTTRLWDDTAFVARMREACERAGRSEREVCWEAGLTPDFLIRVAGYAGRSTEAILRLAAILEVDPGELAFGPRRA